MAVPARMKIAGLVVLCVSAILVGFAAFERSNARQIKSDLKEAKDQFTFDDLYNNKFAYNVISLTWISGNEYIYRDSVGDIKKKNVVDDSDETLVPGNDYTTIGASDYEISADLKYVALRTAYKKGWRHSYNATYVIYDVDSQAVVDAFTTPEDTQYFVWSPTGNALAYVNGFDIYYRPTVDAAPIRITWDGRANNIYNGIPDWVYEEEMISSNNVMYFSPSGDYLAYAQFDDSKCERINFERFDGKKYPDMQVVSYPKATTTHPTNKVFVYDIANNATYDVDPPAKFQGVDYLFNRITWSADDQFAVSWSNRIQTEGIIHLVTVNSVAGNATGVTNPNFEHSSSTGWLYQRRPYWIPVFGDTTQEYYTVRPKGNWQHLYLVSEDGETPITEGNFTVTSESASYPAVEIYDKATKKIYFSATKTSPQHRHIYRNSDTPSDPECITCKYAEDAKYEGRCDYITTQFSTDGSYVVVRCRGDNLPPLQILAQIDHTATDPALVFHDEVELETNAELVTTVGNTDISMKEYGTFTSETGYELSYQIWKPPNFDDTKKYPLLIDVYAGPGYQNVYNQWSRGWSSRFVPSAMDVVVAMVDGRGSNFYGEDFMHTVYKKLGVNEPLDQLEFAKYMSEKAWIDETKIAVWGWSYGGYTTSMILANDGPAEEDRIIRCGLAVAPLTDWRFYDTIYAERYMAVENTDGYDGASVLKKADRFPQSRYVMIHGTADDNVHFQNAARLQSALVEQDIDFKAIYYADQDHSIRVGNARKHVYKVLTRELARCFELEVPEGVWSK